MAAQDSKVSLPATKPFRVRIAGAMYSEPTTVVGFDGVETVVHVSKLGTFGEEIQLTDREAHRLKDLDAIVPADEPLTYDEMNDKQLDAKVKEFGVTVTSSGADADQPLRSDKINALLTFDQGRATAS